MLCKAKAEGSLKVREIWVAEPDGVFLLSSHTELLASHIFKPMANVFGILTAIVLAVSAFVAYQNKNAYDREITATNERKSELSKSKARLKLASDTYDATFAQRTGVDEENVKLAETEIAQKKTNADLDAQVKDKTAKVASNKEKLDAIRDKTSKLGEINQLAAKMRATNAELEELAQTISTTEAKLANLTAENTQTEKEANGLKTMFDTISSGQSLPILNTRIRSIYPTWGFVTLAAGNNGGVTANSTLDVVRDGTTVAKLLVTAVEAGTASASIIPDSVAQDVTLMVGDRVVPAQKAAQPARN
jgi:DNA repair exonuclease SbcCD ATPase subunit